MLWAERRRFIILLIIGSVAAASFAVMFATIFYRPPSCTDGVQNQGEAGIDCGGPCPYLCTALVQPPTVLFTKAISNGAGRVDVIASIENRNATAAAKGVPYTITLYGAGRSSAREITGTIDLPPAAAVPIFVPGVSSGSQNVVRAFLTIDPAAVRWFALANDPRVKPVVSNTAIGGTASAPRIDAVLSNASTVSLINVRVVVFVHDAQGEVIAASQTILPTIPAQQQATATFTWGGAFTGTPTTIEVVPIIPLP